MGLKSLRLRHGLSQEKLATQSNLSLRTIQRIEKGNKASIESINALCTVFEMEFESLKNIIENKEKEVQENVAKQNILHDKKVQSFLIINFMLFIINITTTPEYLWFIYPMLGWGVPLFYRLYFKPKNKVIT